MKKLIVCLMYLLVIACSNKTQIESTNAAEGDKDSQSMINKPTVDPNELAVFDKFIKTAPPASLYMKALQLENSNPDQAKQLYQAIVDRYPTSNYAEKAIARVEAGAGGTEPQSQTSSDPRCITDCQNSYLSCKQQVKDDRDHPINRVGSGVADMAVDKIGNGISEMLGMSDSDSQTVFPPDVNNENSASIGQIGSGMADMTGISSESVNSQKDRDAIMQCGQQKNNCAMLCNQ